MQLDALSNYHYTPDTAKPQVALLANVRSMRKEEVAQTVHSDANTLAPEQILVNLLPCDKYLNDFLRLQQRANHALSTNAPPLSAHMHVASRRKCSIRKR